MSNSLDDYLQGGLIQKEKESDSRNSQYEIFLDPFLMIEIEHGITRKQLKMAWNLMFRFFFFFFSPFISTDECGPQIIFHFERSIAASYQFSRKFF